jgi:hypothetical protein
LHVVSERTHDGVGRGLRPDKRRERLAQLSLLQGVEFGAACIVETHDAPAPHDHAVFKIGPYARRRVSTLPTASANTWPAANAVLPPLVVVVR